MDDPSDRTLVLRTREGEVNAFGELVRRYQTSVFNVCYRFIRERREAEDLAQEAFIRAYQRLETFDADRNFGPWIRRVAANLCLNALQRNPALDLALDDEIYQSPKSPVSDPESSYDKAVQSGAIRAAIWDLPPHYKAVIELRHFQGLSYAEIAAELNTSLSQVKSHLFRARKKLAQTLQGHEFDQ